jgi:hypothetical protein
VLLHQQPQGLVDRLAHLRAVALQAVGHPGQVDRGEQRQVHVAAVQRHGFVVQRPSPKTKRL